MQKQASRLKRALKLLLKISLVLLVLLVVASGYGFYYIYFKNDDLPNLKKLGELQMKRSSYVFSSSNQIVGRFFYEIRDPVKLKDVPEMVKKVVLAAEDKRFFSHYGVDPLAIVRAAVHNYLSRRTVSGASTITQQLTRLLYEDEVPEFKIREMRMSRKRKEARIAIQMERYYSKEEILEAYLNYIYLGHGRFGIVEAARFYFGKELSELTVLEAAVIVGINKYPSKFCPIDRPKAAKERRDLILLLAKENKVISEAEYKEYVQQPIVLNITKNDFDFGYANDFVRRVLLEKGYKTDDIWTKGGLKIKTTIDGRIQKIASRVLREHLATLNILNNKKNKDSFPLEGAVVVIRNFSGEIAAVVGGHDFNETKYNRAVQVSSIRQPGSAFKIFTYATALKEGRGFYDQICDCPIHLPGKISFHGQVLKWWSPRNFHEFSHPDFMGFINLWQGLVLSRNVATVFLAKQFGIKKVIETAQDMGIKSKLDPYLPTAIGASSIGLLELTAAYSVFPGRGMYYEPSIVSEIDDPSGKVLYQAEATSKRALPSEVAESMTVLLRAVTEVGTAKLTFKDIKQKTAGKTGTTNDSRDVLFFGFTPGPNGYTIGVRLGYDMPKSIGARQTGGLLAAPVCRRIIEKIYENQPMDFFSPDVEGKLTQLIHPQPQVQAQPQQAQPPKPQS